MPGRGLQRGDVIAVLNGLVREGVITSFKTSLFEKTRSDLEITVTLPDPEQAGPALLRVRAALEPLGVDLTVAVDLSGRAPDGGDT